MSPSLAGRWALVTGGSRGIGLAVARALIGEGARVLCLARSGRRLDDVVQSLGKGAAAVPCNLASSDEIDDAVATVVATCGGAPDILVQGAGHFPLAPFQDTSPADFGGTMQVNLIGPYRLAQPLAALMRTRGSGHLVTIGSVADRVAFPENVSYSASKFGARAVHEVLREELRSSGVRATLVSPGPVDTTIWDAIDPDSRPGFTPRSRMLTPDAVADAIRWVVTRPPEVNVDELRLGRA
jgi:NAD(P)-dependent dehydrogenase (short-subunit alcohol dehydrogenase family)